ncbi:MAG TPA: MFS transporter [Thermoleophilia bacterium]|nr:MFS transporter [Thermoleophilia bacterium]
MASQPTPQAAESRRDDVDSTLTTADSRAPVPRHLGLALVVIATAQLMIVLDATIVNVALPHIQRALGFSGSGLEWVVTAYSLAFGSLLLFGGRLGDIYGRRRIFIIGVTTFSLASLLGGLATSEWWILAARVVQGAGGALAAPTALALIATTFPAGPPRNRAFGVYAGMSGAGGAVGLLLGGILTTYASWRWVFFVNVPIGLTVICLAPIALVPTVRSRLRLDIPGVVTSCAGLALLVYGLTHAAAGRDGVSHWSSPLTIGALGGAVALLVAFVAIERRTSHPELPLHLLRSRRRSGSYIMMLLLYTGLFSSFFFLTIYFQTVYGYSPVRTGLAWVPFPITIILVSTLVARVLVNRIGVRPLLLLGPVLASTGFLWLSRLSVDGHYWPNLLPGMLLVSGGMGCMLVPLTLMVVSRVAPQETGVASSGVNIGQQVGGAIGLAAIGTITWTSVAHSLTSQMAAGAAGGTGVAAGATSPVPASVLNRALTSGFSTGLEVAAAVVLAGFFVALVSTYTPGRIRLSSAVRKSREEVCDEALGSC